MGPPCGMVGTDGRMGIHAFPFAWSTVRSITTVAVAVFPDTVAVTVTVSPDFTLAIPDSPPFTLVEESTVNVPDVPSADLTVSDHVLPEVFELADTVPVRTSI